MEVNLNEKLSSRIANLLNKRQAIENQLNEVIGIITDANGIENVKNIELNLEENKLIYILNDADLQEK